MVKSAELHAAARSFVSGIWPQLAGSSNGSSGSSSSGSSSRRFLAVHIRPYADACLDVWKSQPFNASAAAGRKCSMPGLHGGIAAEARRQMKLHGLQGDQARGL